MMRILLIIVVVGSICALAQGAQAQQSEEVRSVDSKLRVYMDDDHVTVVSPSVAAHLEIGETLEVDVSSTIDVVSAASVDVVTSASPSAIHERRVEGGGTLLYSLSPEFRVRLGTVFSHENDYDTFRPTVGGQLEVAQRNAILDVAYTPTFDDIGSSVDPMFSKRRRGHILALGFTQIVNRRTYFDVGLDARYLRGFHASAYRRVAIAATESPAVERVAEATPTVRKSGAALLRIRRALGAEPSWFLHASYRFYGDSWHVLSHTVDAEILHSMSSDRYLFGLRLRGYQQGRANFYQAYYESLSDGSVPRYRTRDRILGGMMSAHVSLTLDAAIGHDVGAKAWRLRSMLSATQFVFSDFPAQRQRRALALSLSLSAPL